MSQIDRGLKYFKTVLNDAKAKKSVALLKQLTCRYEVIAKKSALLIYQLAYCIGGEAKKSAVLLYQLT